MGLIQRMKGWFTPNSSRSNADHAAGAPTSGTAVAGFVQRLAADVEFVAPANRERSLAVLMPPAIAAAAPIRAIPLFLVPATVEAADVEIVHPPRVAPKLHIVHNADRNNEAQKSDTTFRLAARLASVAHLNTPAGRQPTKPAIRVDAQANAKNRAKTANRPTTEPAISTKRTAKGNTPAAKPGQCFVRPQSAGKAAVSAVPQRAKRRAS
jgi:hypothetical protein